MRITALPPARVIGGQAGISAARPVGGFALAGGAQRASASNAVAGAQMAVMLPVGDALERRRQGARRGRALLDALDGLKLALLSGQATGAALSLLARESGVIDAGDDPALGAILEAIGLRADVELAKAQARTGPL